jgi:hypothetical protein
VRTKLTKLTKSAPALIPRWLFPQAAAAEMAMEEGTHLLSGQEAVGGRVDDFEDTVGGVVAGGCAEEEGGACGDVFAACETG